MTPRNIHATIMRLFFLDQTKISEPEGGNSDRTHVSGPFMIPDIRRLIPEATQVHEKNRRQNVPLNSIVAHIPLEIRIIIVDMIYQSPPTCYGRVHDTPNILEAFQWRMPISYWQKLCNPTLIFEVQDIIEAGTPIHWAYFCHGLHELLLQEDWYCNSGLYVRGRIPHLTERLKECLSESV